ncbi:hypothetical protein C1H76_8151 [Elsinoe australis]|uniref:Uncharacterized protein n=1 Tax=Elsinoe australis TaxID=40998 RepID=A0A4U7ARQ8_9PEZI|nr:hypothetical protein C1H76_8151 [Elsinoe australis]
MAPTMFSGSVRNPPSVALRAQTHKLGYTHQMDEEDSESEDDAPPSFPPRDTGKPVTLNRRWCAPCLRRFTHFFVERNQRASRRLCVISRVDACQECRSVSTPCYFHADDKVTKVDALIRKLEEINKINSFDADDDAKLERCRAEALELLDALDAPDSGLTRYELDMDPRRRADRANQSRRRLAH